MPDLSMKALGARHRAVHHLVDHPDYDAQNAATSWRGGLPDALDEVLVRLQTLLADVCDLSTARVAVFPEAPPVRLFLRCRVQARGEVERRLTSEDGLPRDGGQRWHPREDGVLA